MGFAALTHPTNDKITMRDFAQLYAALDETKPDE